MDHAAFRKLISGEKRGIGPALGRLALWPLSLIYGGVVGCRNFCWDLGWFVPAKPACPVLSVGNLTTGGTGKTPVVAYLANWFKHQNIKVVLISRGYKQLESGVNDEKLVLDRLCPGVPHLLNKNRVKAVQQAISEYGAEVVILDDGFQHRRLGRTLDLVLLDMSSPWGYGHLLPRGMLRESKRGLRRADLVMLTRVDQVESEAVSQVQQEQKRQRPKLKGKNKKRKPAPNEAIEVSFPPESLLNASGESVNLSQYRGEKIGAFCGIGNPVAFENSLREQGLETVFFKAFPDHHHYYDQELNEVIEQTREAGGNFVVTTLKDLVKIEKDSWKHLPIWALTTGIQFNANRELLDDQLEKLAEKILEEREI